MKPLNSAPPHLPLLFLQLLSIFRLFCAWRSTPRSYLSAVVTRGSRLRCWSLVQTQISQSSLFPCFWVIRSGAACWFCSFRRLFDAFTAFALKRASRQKARPVAFHPFTHPSDHLAAGGLQLTPPPRSPCAQHHAATNTLCSILSLRIDTTGR